MPKRKEPSPSTSPTKKRRVSGRTDAPAITDAEQVTKPEFVDRYRLPDMPRADVFYMPNFVDDSTADGWYDELAALHTWYQPTLKVYGKSVTQSRLIAAYVTDPSMTVKYSGHPVELHYPYPPFLSDIQARVEAVLGVKFNHVMLNRYDDGTVYIGKHNDTKENKVIASVSVGAERTFIMAPKKGGPGEVKRWNLANGSLVVMQGATQLNWKHEIPKEPKIREGRISLTFRQLVYDQPTKHRGS